MSEPSRAQSRTTHPYPLDKGNEGSENEIDKLPYVKYKFGKPGLCTTDSCVIYIQRKKRCPEQSVNRKGGDLTPEICTFYVNFNPLKPHLLLFSNKNLNKVKRFQEGCWVLSFMLYSFYLTARFFNCVYYVIQYYDIDYSRTQCASVRFCNPRRCESFFHDEKTNKRKVTLKPSDIKNDMEVPYSIFIKLKLLPEAYGNLSCITTYPYLEN